MAADLFFQKQVVPLFLYVLRENFPDVFSE